MDCFWYVTQSEQFKMREQLDICERSQSCKPTKHMLYQLNGLYLLSECPSFARCFDAGIVLHGENTEKQQVRPPHIFLVPS